MCHDQWDDNGARVACRALEFVHVYLTQYEILTVHSIFYILYVKFNGSFEHVCNGGFETLLQRLQ